MRAFVLIYPRGGSLKAKSGKAFALDRVDAIYQAGGFQTKKAYQEMRQMVREAYEAFARARAKLGDADYDSLRPEFIACRRWGHQWPSQGWTFIGHSVGGGFGLTYQNTCECCGMVARRYKTSWGRANGGSEYDQPEGYKLEGLLEQLSRPDVQAIEFIGELENILKALEQSVGINRLRAVS